MEMCREQIVRDEGEHGSEMAVAGCSLALLCP